MHELDQLAIKIDSDHRDMVAKLAKSGALVLADLDPVRVNLWHAWTGIVTEVGELGDAIKAMVIYNRQLDMENVVEELGDIEFHLQQFRQQLCIRRGETLTANMQKLAKRYPNWQYSDDNANTRADKQNEGK
jgi:NTP pyrophosphatase (non-canonical NTP hydrolase)